ncbi:MAG: hypothetical protein GXO83_05085 [Chlorobi bacterium]|nr:hypothetical protein [Chlorobiota bacterium]
MERAFNTIRSEEQGAVRLLFLNRPEALNALNGEVFREMNLYLDALENDTGAGILIITGEGKAFAAGADIAEMAEMDSEEAFLFSQTGQSLFSRLETLPIPVIAAVNGYALGGGCELAMACDIRIMSRKARLGQPEVNLGLIPGFSGTQRMSRHIGLGNALYYLFSARQIDAEEALRTGLVQQVTEADELMDAVTTLAEEILAKGPQAIRKMKAVVREGLETGFSDGSILESRNFGSLFGGEGTEGMKAFLEKRKPEWKPDKT